MSRQTIARTKQDTFEIVPEGGIERIGASYSHIKSLKNIVGPNTKTIVAQHAMIESLDGLEKTNGLENAYLAFNRITHFRENNNINGVNVLDLAGNPIKSLINCPIVKNLIVSSTLITNLEGIPEGVEIVRCGHSQLLTSLKGCPSTVKLIECSCAPNLIIDETHLPIGLEELITDID